jgi:hypothetical protein
MGALQGAANIALLPIYILIWSENAANTEAVSA